MKTVTAIVEQKKDKKRVNVYLDGEFCCGMDLFTVMSERIKVGTEIDEKRLEEVVAMSEYSSALDKALGYISKTMRTKVQLITYLKGKNYDGKTIAKVIDKLFEYGYVDDELYAKRFAAEKKLSKGKRAIAYELKIKGVDEKTIDKVMDEAAEEDEGCMRVAVKYLKGRELDFETRGKCYRYLLSKGFSYDTAKETLDKIKKDDEDY